MLDHQRFALHFGPYAPPPPFNYGDVVMDEVRGEVRVHIRQFREAERGRTRVV